MGNERKKVNVMPNQEMIDEANKVNKLTENTIPASSTEELASQNMEVLTHEQQRNQKHKKYLLEKQRNEGKLDYHDQSQLDAILELEKRPDLAIPSETDTYIVKPKKEVQETSTNEFREERKLDTTNYHKPEQPVDLSKAPIGYREVVNQNFNQPYDLIPLPSEGKIYPHKRKSLKVGYLNAADENILTSPNLVQSGEFIDILLERKILDPDIQLKDLHSGDRNAILIWLRATGYGEKYPIILTDPNTEEEIHTIFDLTTLKTIKLGDEPDNEGLFDYTFKRSGVKIKFKLLTIGDLDDITGFIEYEKLVLNLETPNEINHRFRRQIVEVNGSRDIHIIDDLINTLRIGDSMDLVEHIASIESGVDLKISIDVPGREQPIATFLPLTREFFWPNERL